MSHAIQIASPVTARDILQAALALPEAERAMLVEELEASLHPEDDAKASAFVAMLNERDAAVEQGTVRCIPAAEVFARLRAR